MTIGDQRYYNTGTFSTGGTWQVTSGLKWIGGVLYQAWQCLDDGKVEWKPVPSDPPFAAGMPSKEGK